MVSCRTDWSTPAFDLAAVAPDLGPFPRRPFLEGLWNLSPTGDLCLVESRSALIPLVHRESGLQWIGHPDLVDYRSPLGEEAVDLIAGFLASKPSGLHYRFDSLPAEAADLVGRGLVGAGLKVPPQQHTVAARLLLPAHHDAYLDGIGKKQRHEIRRKRRRFHDEHGSPQLTTTRGIGEGFNQFVKMHRDSGGTKGRFMTAEMSTWFATLAGQDGWQVDLLSGEAGDPVAATFAWTDGEGYYLYNSAYDRKAPGSPGMVLLSLLIERAIEESYRVFDFLKGDEPYKFRLGATPRPLFRFEGST
ncbi:MAG: GNAT family N-acetyltransferase [Acidimicrobiia bacterium]|nr:GNAT family N-acetyltransferase [Acidimicrobiia bacterium]